MAKNYEIYKDSDGKKRIKITPKEDLTAKDLENFLDRLAFEQTRKMIEILAKNLSEKTKFEAIPVGNYTWRICQWKKIDGNPYYLDYPSFHIVNLVRFFGMVVGYCEETDTLVYWDNDKDAPADLFKRIKNGKDK